MWDGIVYVLVLLCLALLLALEFGIRLPTGTLPVTGPRQKALLRAVVLFGLVCLLVDFSRGTSLTPWLPLQALLMLFMAAPFIIAFLLIPASLLVFVVMTVLKVRESIIERRKPNPH